MTTLTLRRGTISVANLVLLWFLFLQQGTTTVNASGAIDPYAILHVTRNASQEDIRKSYKTLCLRYHPDKNIDRSPTERKQFEEHFKEIQKAYSLIGDKETRRNHDLLNRYGGDSPYQHNQRYQPSSSSANRNSPYGRERYTFSPDFRDFFKYTQGGRRGWHPFGAPSFFGASSSQAAAAAAASPSDFFNLSRFKSVYVRKVPVSLEDLYNGKMGHEFSLQSSSLWQRLTASFRGGYGMVLLYQSLLFALPMMRFSKLVSLCLGMFLFYNHIPEPSKDYFLADIKAGYKGGTKLIFTEDGFDAVFILTEIDHPRFVRQGNDLYTVVYVNSRQARHGATVSTTHLDGTQVSVPVPAGSQSGKLVRVSNQGWPDRKKGIRGDLYVHVLVKAKV